MRERLILETRYIVPALIMWGAVATYIGGAIGCLICAVVTLGYSLVTIYCVVAMNREGGKGQ